MSTIFTIDLETGDLTQFTGTGGGEDLAATTAAKLHGVYGMACTINDTSDHHGYKTITATGTLRYRLYFDPNALTMGVGDEFALVRLLQWGAAYSLIHALWVIPDGSAYRFMLEINDDAGTNIAGWDQCNLTDAMHYVEISIVRATNSTSADGTAQWWVDGVSQGSWTGIDNYNRMADPASHRYYFGMFQPDAGTSGTFYVDDITMNDDGGAIGPVVATMPDERPLGINKGLGKRITTTR